MTGWSKRLAALASSRHRLVWALVLTLVSVSALAAEREEVRAAQNAADAGERLVALVKAGGDLDRATLESLAEGEHPVVVAWIAAVRIQRATTAAELFAARQQAARGGVGPLVLGDLDRLGHARLEELVAEHPSQILQYARAMPITEGVAARIAADPDWLVAALLTQETAGLRSVAAALVPLVIDEDRRVVRALLEALDGPGPLADRDAPVPWAGGPLFLPQLSLSRRERTQLADSLEDWVRWAVVFERREVEQQARRGLAAVDPARLRDLP